LRNALKRFVTPTVVVLLVLVSVPAEAWKNPPPATWYTNGASNERYWQSGVASLAAPPQGVVSGIWAAFRPDKTVPPIQFGPDILLTAGREFPLITSQPPQCLLANDAGAQPTVIMATRSAGQAIGATLVATSFNTLTGRQCDALVAPVLVTAAAGPDSQMIVAKVVDFTGGTGLHLLFISLTCGGGPPCFYHFGLVVDVFAGILPAKPSTALWWEPNQGQGYSALQDPLNPRSFYDDLVFISMAGAGYGSRMISIDFGAASANRWQDRFAPFWPVPPPPACPGPFGCAWDPINPPPVWPGYVRATNDLAEFSKIGPNWAGHFTGMNLIDGQSSRPWLVVVDFLPGNPQAYFSQAILTVPIPALPPTVFGLTCYTYFPQNPLGPPPGFDGPHPLGPGGWLPGEIGTCLNSYEDPNLNFLPSVKKIMLQYDPAWGPVVPCSPVRPGVLCWVNYQPASQREPCSER
jgi:hypothetical protein